MNYEDKIQFEKLNINRTKIPSEICIICHTYNHGRFIKNALDGFINQDFSMSYYVLVVDDASDDNTSNIVREYASKYPEYIVALIAKKNMYSQGCWGQYVCSLYEEYVVSKYVALCEGDDCWIDKNKLNIQYNYLEKHSDCSLICHNAVCYDYFNDSFLIDLYGEREYDVPADDIITQNLLIPTSSVFLKRVCLNNPEITPYFFLDYAFLLRCLVNGKVHYTDRVMSLYRYNVSGSHSDRNRKDIHYRTVFMLNLLVFLDDFNEHTQNMHCHSIDIKKTRLLNDYFSKIENQEENTEETIIGLINEINNIKKKRYAEELFRVFKQRTDINYLSDYLRNIVDSNKRIMIFGIGCGATILAEQLKNNSKEVDGYVVSIKQSDEFMGKEVMNIDTFLAKDEDCCLIVSPYSIPPFELRKVLENDKKIKLYFPFEFKVNC